MTAQEIKEVVNSTLKVDIKNTARDRDLSEGRLIYFHLCSANGVHPKDSGALVNKDRTTAIYSIKKFSTLVNNNYDFRAKFQRVQHAMGVENIELPVSEGEAVKSIKSELDKANEYITMLEKRALKFADIKATLYEMARPKDEEEINYFLRQIIAKINVGINN